MALSVSLPAAIAPNLLVIRQGIELLTAIGPDHYNLRVPMAYNASIGGHVRHIIDHYHSFLAGCEARRLDYENRPRSAAIEQDSTLACHLLGEIAQRLEHLDAESAEHTLAYCAETAPGRCAPTSVVRELEFLFSHTIHHYALVAVMCRLLGHEPAPGFGVAPSTLRHEQSLAACAR